MHHGITIAVTGTVQNFARFAESSDYEYIKESLFKLRVFSLEFCAVTSLRICCSHTLHDV